MEDAPDNRIDHPEKLCDAVAGIVDELEDSELIGAKRASELRSQVYRSIDVREE